MPARFTNTAFRCMFDHISTTIQGWLQWLRVCKCIKICIQMHNCLKNCAPRYLADHISRMSLTDSNNHRSPLMSLCLEPRLERVVHIPGTVFPQLFMKPRPHSAFKIQLKPLSTFALTSIDKQSWKASWNYLANNNDGTKIFIFTITITSWHLLLPAIHLRFRTVSICSLPHDIRTLPL